LVTNPAINIVHTNKSIVRILNKKYLIMQFDAPLAVCHC